MKDLPRRSRYSDSDAQITESQIAQAVKEAFSSCLSQLQSGEKCPTMIVIPSIEINIQINRASGGGAAVNVVNGKSYAEKRDAVQIPRS